jgi:hypothetical protein
VCNWQIFHHAIIDEHTCGLFTRALVNCLGESTRGELQQNQTQAQLNAAMTSICRCGLCGAVPGIQCALQLECLRREFCKLYFKCSRIPYCESIRPTVAQLRGLCEVEVTQ